MTPRMAGGPDAPEGPERRKDADRRALMDQVAVLFRGIRLWINVLAALLFVLGGVSVWMIAEQQDTLSRIQHSREIGTRVTCAVIGSVAQAGKAAIVQAAPLPPKFEHALEALGYPPFAVRKRQARAAGAAYVAGISTRIDQAIGRRGDGLVNSDGTINCARLVRAVQLR